MPVHKPLCVGIGEVLWDLLPGGKALGGAPVNVVAHAAQLGARAAVVSAVGNDADGLEILECLRAMLVDTSGIRVIEGLPTGVVDVRLDHAGVPTFTIRAPAAWDAIDTDEKLERLAAAADAIVFGTLAQRDPRSREGIRRFLRAARPECLKVFDINLRRPFYSQEAVCGLLGQVDVLKLSDAELPVLAEMLDLTGDETSVLGAISFRFDVKLLVFTRGAKGSRMITPHWDASHPGYNVELVDTVGAGDAFTAVVTVGLLRGMPLAEIQELANRIAAFVCSQEGAIPRLPAEIAHRFHFGSQAR